MIDYSFKVFISVVFLFLYIGNPVEAKTEIQKQWKTVTPEIYKSEVKVLEREYLTNEEENSESTSPYSTFPLSSTFFELRLNESIKLNTSSPDRLIKTPVDIDFMFSRTESVHKSQTVHLWLNGHKHSSYQLNQIRGSFTVEKITQGIHTFEFRTSDKDDEICIFVNKPPLEFSSKNSSLWRKRTFYTLTSEEPLTLFLYKTQRTPILLNIAGYFSVRRSERCALKVKITPLSHEIQTTSDDYTSLEQIYYLKNQISQDKDDIIPITDSPFSSPSVLSEQRKFAIKLGDDLGIGRYAINFELIGELDGMLRFFYSENKPFILKKGQLAILNLSGPGNLKVEALNLSYKISEQTLQVTRLSAQGKITMEVLSLPKPDDSGKSALKINVPSGMATFRIKNTNLSELSLIFYADNVTEMLIDKFLLWTEKKMSVYKKSASLRSLSEAPSLRREKNRWKRIEPDIGNYDYFQCSPQEDLEIVLNQDDSENPTLRIISRVPTKLDEKTPNRCNMNYRILDKTGRTIVAGVLSVESTISEDAFYYPKEFYSEIPSEAVYRYIELPENAASLKFSSEKTVHLRFHRRLSSVERETYVPEDYTQPETVKLHPTSKSEWEAIVPENNDILARAGKIVKVQTQRQLISPAERETELKKKVAKTITPDDYEQKNDVFEPYQITEKSKFEPSIATYCRLLLNENVLLNVVNYDLPGGKVPTDVQLFYKLPLYLKEKSTIKFIMNNKLFTEFPITSPQNRLYLNSIKPGLHHFRVESSPQNNIESYRIKLFINQLPVDLKNASIWKQRTVYSLTSEKSLSISITKNSYQPITVNVVAYYDNDNITKPERFTVLTVIDDGIRQAPPDVTSTQYTTLVRKYNIKNQPSRAFYVNRSEIKPGQAQTFFVPLYDDISPGQHRLRFKLLSGKSAKIRFFIMKSDEVKEKAKFWEESIDDEIRG